MSKFLPVTEEEIYLHNHPLGEEIEGHVRVGEKRNHKGKDYIIVSRGPSADCGCPEELLDIDGFGVICHFEDDGSGEATFVLENDDFVKVYQVETMAELRNKAVESYIAGW